MGLGYVLYSSKSFRSCLPHSTRYLHFCRKGKTNFFFSCFKPDQSPDSSSKFIKTEIISSNLSRTTKLFILEIIYFRPPTHICSQKPCKFHSLQHLMDLEPRQQQDHMNIFLFFICILPPFRKTKETRVNYLSFENIGAQNMKSDLPRFSGLFKNGHIFNILNFQALLFWDIRCLLEFFQIPKKSRRSISQNITTCPNLPQP